MVAERVCVVFVDGVGVGVSVGVGFQRRRVGGKEGSVDQDEVCRCEVTKNKVSEQGGGRGSGEEKNNKLRKGTEERACR